MDEILIETGVGKEEYNLIKAGKRRMDLTKYKVEYAKAALSNKYTFKEIGSNIGMSDTGVRNLLKRNQVLLFGVWHHNLPQKGA